MPYKCQVANIFWAFALKPIDDLQNRPQNPLLQSSEFPNLGLMVQIRNFRLTPRRAIFLCIWLLLFAYYTNAIVKRCQFCYKIFKSLGIHSWTCKTKLHIAPLQVGPNHDNGIDFNINIVENQSHSIVDFYDQYTLEQPKVLVTELNEEIQQNKN